MLSTPGTPGQGDPGDVLSRPQSWEQMMAWPTQLFIFCGGSQQRGGARKLVRRDSRLMPKPATHTLKVVQAVTDVCVMLRMVFPSQWCTALCRHAACLAPGALCFASFQNFLFTSEIGQGNPKAVLFLALHSSPRWGRCRFYLRGLLVCVKHFNGFSLVLAQSLNS